MLPNDIGLMLKYCIIKIAWKMPINFMVLLLNVL